MAAVPGGQVLYLLKTQAKDGKVFDNASVLFDADTIRHGAHALRDLTVRDIALHALKWLTGQSLSLPEDREKANEELEKMEMWVEGADASDVLRKLALGDEDTWKASLKSFDPLTLTITTDRLLKGIKTKDVSITSSVRACFRAVTVSVAFCLLYGFPSHAPSSFILHRPSTPPLHTGRSSSR